MEKVINPKLKVLLRIFISIIILFQLRLILANQIQGENVTNLPFCQTKEDIKKYQGRLVNLIGVYKYTDAGKCWVAKVLLKDASVIIRYQPPLEEVEKFDNKNVIVIGKILESYPKEGLNSQWLISAHLVDIQSIEEYISSFQPENIISPP